MRVLGLAVLLLVGGSFAVSAQGNCTCTTSASDHAVKDLSRYKSAFAGKVVSVEPDGLLIANLIDSVTEGLHMLLDALPWGDMVDDLSQLLPRIVAAESASRIIYGLYTPGQDGRLAFAFHCSS